MNKLSENGPFKAVINLAARAGVRTSLKNPWIYANTNYLGALNLLEFCKNNSIKKFILASMSSIYGNTEIHPIPETESSSIPLQPYAATKKAAEVLCHSYHYLYGIDVSILRFFTVYGPAGRPDMAMLRFIHSIYNGLPIRLNGDGT